MFTNYEFVFTLHFISLEVTHLPHNIKHLGGLYLLHHITLEEPHSPPIQAKTLVQLVLTTPYFTVRILKLFIDIDIDVNHIFKCEKYAPL